MASRSAAGSHARHRVNAVGRATDVAVHVAAVDAGDAVAARRHYELPIGFAED